MQRDLYKKYTNAVIDTLIAELQPLVSQIDAQLSKGIAIYGAGFLGAWAVKYLRSLDVNILFFMDRSAEKIGTKLEDIPIISPEDAQVSAAQALLIGARHAVHQVKPLYEDRLPTMSFDGYYVVKNFEKFRDVRENYLVDEKSQYIFNALLHAMLTGSTKSCLEVMEKGMYFSIPEFSGTFDETFVDAGAFVGDSVEGFIWENLGTFKHIYAFEPGERQFKALESRMKRLVEEWAIDPKHISLEKAGLSHKKDEMSCIYTGDYPLRHALAAEKTDNTVPTYALDAYLDGREVSFIKVDIEGMEMEFLQGAVQTIQKYKPKMALCAYHYPCDLFTLANYVRELCPEYSFKLRHYAPLFGDFVLYCYVEDSPC